MRLWILHLLIGLNHATATVALWWARRTPPPSEPPADWIAWARHFGDGRNWWEPIAYRPSEESAWCCIGRYVEQYPGTSCCVLPRGQKPEEPPPCNAPEPDFS